MSLTVQSGAGGSGGGAKTSLLPSAVGMVILGGYAIMTLARAVLMKSCWKLIKPRPETIRVRLEPKDLTKAVGPEPPVLPKE